MYGLAAASLVPVLFGVLYRGSLPLWLVGGAALIGLLLHFYLNLFAGVLNPAVSASYAILASLAYGGLGLVLLRKLNSV